MIEKPSSNEKEAYIIRPENHMKNPEVGKAFQQFASSCPERPRK
jgi:hypothetical protein